MKDRTERAGLGGAVDAGVGAAAENGSAGVVDLQAAPAFERFLELVPDAIVLVGDDGRIAAVNSQAERLFGYTKGELTGESLQVLIPESRRKYHPAHREAYFADPRKRPMGLGLELAGRRKDGSEFPADISLSAIETTNGLVAAAAVRDVSERIEAERERRALEAEAMEARDQQARRLESIGELAGGIAHDFNNLLAVILSNAELALDELNGETIREELAEIHGAADHASQLTRQLLIFSRNEVTARERVDLSSIVRDILALLRRSIGESIDLDVRLSDDLPQVMADPSQMERVLLNLAINARDAMPGGGRLGIETSVAVLDQEYTRSRPDVVPGRYVRLTVADEGIGMAPDVVARAFEPFFTTKAKGEGTGLGLATVYGIVKSAGGHVSIYSEEGQGTVIRVHIPLAGVGEGEEEADDVADTITRGGGQTVLVVEDADRVRRTVVKILERGGYRVLAASGGSEALSIFRKDEGAIDLLLTDIVMAGIPGTEIAKEMKVIRPDLPVLYMSGYADVAAPVDADAETIEKPFTTPGLLGRVAEELASRSEPH